jgi:hypothetical protein
MFYIKCLLNFFHQIKIILYLIINTVSLLKENTQNLETLEIFYSKNLSRLEKFDKIMKIIY